MPLRVDCLTGVVKSPESDCWKEIGKCTARGGGGISPGQQVKINQETVNKPNQTNTFDTVIDESMTMGLVVCLDNLKKPGRLGGCARGPRVGGSSGG